MTILIHINYINQTQKLFLRNKHSINIEVNSKISTTEAIYSNYSKHDKSKLAIYTYVVSAFSEVLSLSLVPVVISCSVVVAVLYTINSNKALHHNIYRYFIIKMSTMIMISNNKPPTTTTGITTATITLSSVVSPKDLNRYYSTAFTSTGSTLYRW